MLPQSKNYEIYPAVAKVNHETEFIIAPAERSFLLYEGEEYELIIIPINGDEPNYYHPTQRQKIKLVASEGILRFTYTPDKEQEYSLRLLYQGKLKENFAIYAVHDDLYGLRPLKGDLHAHSYRSDGARDPAALAGHYREQGYDFFALTDHNRYYPGAEIDEVYEGVKLGITRVKGEEIHAVGNVVHIVHVGGDKSVCEEYVNNQEGFADVVKPYYERIPADVPEQYHDRYARCLWATERAHKAGGIAIFPHPFWMPKTSSMYNVCEEFARILLKSGMFDAYELMGGMGQASGNKSVALWSEVRAEGCDIPVVASSDVHGIDNSHAFPHHFTICFAKSNDNGAIIDAVRNGLSVAVEAVGDEYKRQYRCYGKLRLVAYAHFLLKNYFVPMQRICQGEGVAMRSYAMCDAPAALIETQVEQTERFRLRFFGQKEALLPNEEIKDFIARARERQMQGPTSRGSSLEPNNRQL